MFISSICLMMEFCYKWQILFLKRFEAPATKQSNITRINIRKVCFYKTMDKLKRCTSLGWMIYFALV